MKRLLFPYAPDPAESLIGAFAEALHGHRIRSVRTGIEGAGFSLARPGSLQMAPDDRITAIASVMRTDPGLLRATAFSSTVARGRISLGDLEIPRAVIDLERRRISPRRLKDANFHRADWLNLLLPYCPHSLELLVDSCPACGPLGWTVTRGVANCDQCGEAIPPSLAPALGTELTGPYRFAADLMSRNSVIGTAAASRLPEAVPAFSRSAICDVMMRAGIVFGRRSVGGAIVNLVAQPPAEVVTVITTGARMIAGWPSSIKKEVRARTAEMGGDLPAYDRLRNDLRWIAQGSEEGGRLIAMAFPTLDGRTADPFASDRRYYTATQTNTKLWTSSSDLKLLRDSRAIDYEELPSNRRLRARYDADHVDALRAALDDGTSPGAAASELDVPIYALGQLVEAGLLELSEAPGVHVLRGVQISKRSIRELIKMVTGAASDRLPAAACVPVRQLLAAYPGEKPWGECLDQLISSKVALHAGGDGFSIRNLLLRSADLPKLSAVNGAVERDPTGIARIPLRDAYEVLGAPDEEAMAAIRSARLEILSEGRGKSVCRSELRGLAAEIAFAGEVALHEGACPIATFHRLSRQKIPRAHGAWSRSALMLRGMVRPMMSPEVNEPVSTAQSG